MNPAGRFDVMSYCFNVWISRYHFTRALDHLQSSPIATGIGSGTAVRGRMSVDGIVSVQMLPVTRVRQAHGAQGIYRFQAFDQNGQLLADQPFSVHQVADKDTFGEGGFEFHLNIDATAIDHYRILRDGAVTYQASMARQSALPVVVQSAGDRWHVSWPDGASPQTVIVRDTQGRVVTIDRSGSLELPAHIDIGTIEAVRNGRRASMQRITHIGR